MEMFEDRDPGIEAAFEVGMIATDVRSKYDFQLVILVTSCSLLVVR